MAGKVISDSELSEEVFDSTSEASDLENYSTQKKNKTISAKKVCFGIVSPK